MIGRDDILKRIKTDEGRFSLTTTEDQQFTSADISINSSKVPAVFNKVNWKSGTVNVELYYTPFVSLSIAKETGNNHYKTHRIFAPYVKDFELVDNKEEATNHSLTENSQGLRITSSDINISLHNSESKGFSKKDPGVNILSESY